jgi:hypothetical protein
MQRINLYQEQFRRRRDPTDATHLALWLLRAVVVLAAIGGLLGWRGHVAEERLAVAEARQGELTERLGELQGRLEEARTDDGDASRRQQRLRAELAAKERLLAYLESGPLAEQAGFSPYLRGLARHVVEGLWVERIALDGGGSRIRLEGHALEAEHVPALVSALGEARVYRGHRFRALEIQRPEERPGQVDFQLATDPAREEGEPS